MFGLFCCWSFFLAVFIFGVAFLAFSAAGYICGWLVSDLLVSLLSLALILAFSLLAGLVLAIFGVGWSWLMAE